MREHVDDAKPAAVFHELFRLVETAEIDARGPASLGPAQPAPDVFVLEKAQVGVELFAEIAIDPARPKQLPHAREEDAPGHHGFTPSRFEHALDDRRDARPAFGFSRELTCPARRQAVELGAPVVLGRAPLRANPPLLLELHERGVERALIEPQRVAAHLLDAPRDAVAVLRPERVERLQNHEGERAL